MKTGLIKLNWITLHIQLPNVKHYLKYYDLIFVELCDLQAQLNLSIIPSMFRIKIYFNNIQMGHWLHNRNLHICFLAKVEHPSYCRKLFSSVGFNFPLAKALLYKLFDFGWTYFSNLLVIGNLIKMCQQDDTLFAKKKI